MRMSATPPSRGSRNNCCCPRPSTPGEFEVCGVSRYRPGAFETAPLRGLATQIPQDSGGPSQLYFSGSVHYDFKRTFPLVERAVSSNAGLSLIGLPEKSRNRHPYSYYRIDAHEKPLNDARARAVPSFKSLVSNLHDPGSAASLHHDRHLVARPAEGPQARPFHPLPRRLTPGAELTEESNWPHLRVTFACGRRDHPVPSARPRLRSLAHRPEGFSDVVLFLGERAVIVAANVTFVALI